MINLKGCFVLSLPLFLIFACTRDKSIESAPEEDNPLFFEEISEPVPFVISTWVHGSSEFVDSIWRKKILTYDSLGISEVLVQAKPDFLGQLIPMANEFNIKVHAWMWTLNQPGNKETQKHPEWYSVNREGENSLEYRPYVNYYQWLSPFHPDACQYIINQVKSYCEIEGLASVHLDYVRYVDVILGADLQPKYKIVQNTELPQYDFGYHPIAREGFKELFGTDPALMPHPELSTEWRQYRLNAVTDLVNNIAEVVHENEIRLTAAVFPFPEMSRQMVRQAWDDWNLDAAYPMLYHNFYRQNINWIGFAAQQGLNDVDFPVHAGLFAPALRGTSDFEAAIFLAKEKGTAGVCIFTADGMTENQKSILKKLKGNF